MKWKRRGDYARSMGDTFPQFTPLGDSAVVVRLGDQIDLKTFHEVRAWSQFLAEHSFPGFVEQTPAFNSVTLYYDPGCISWDDVSGWLQGNVAGVGASAPHAGRTVEIPVCYGGEFGKDLDFVAQHAGLPPREVVEIHSQLDYLVYLIGFAPGFPYLGGMSERIAAPRRKSPRLKVPAGSVGIAGTQTGIYPLETPGGWQLIGRTPLALFRPDENPPTLLQAGDTVRFRPIGEREFHALGGGAR